MSYLLPAAALLLVFVAVAHSYLGERYLLIRLFRRENLPRLYGTDLWTKRILRFGWHLTTIAWLGFAALLLVLAREQGRPRPGAATLVPDIGVVLVATFVVSAIVIAVASRLRHPAWAIFAAAAVLTGTAL